VSQKKRALLIVDRPRPPPASRSRAFRLEGHESPSSADNANKALEMAKSQNSISSFPML